MIRRRMHIVIFLKRTIWIVHNLSLIHILNGVPCETRRKQDNIPQFSTECVTQENENINPYMAEADFDEKAFGMILLRMKE